MTVIYNTSTQYFYIPPVPLNEYGMVPVDGLLSLGAGSTSVLLSSLLTNIKSTTVGHPAATELDKISQITYGEMNVIIQVSTVCNYSYNEL